MGKNTSVVSVTMYIYDGWNDLFWDVRIGPLYIVILQELDLHFWNYEGDRRGSDAEIPGLKP